jgi:hypothetical protein
MNQVPQVQFRRCVAAFELDPPLRIGVVEQQLVVARSAKFLAAHAPLRRRVAVACVVARRAVPDRAVATREVALRRPGMVVCGPEQRCRVVRSCLPTWRRGDPALPLAVVQRPDNDRPVDVIFEKLHHHFLPDPRQELAAHATTGRALRHPHPATRVATVLPVEPDADAAQPVAVKFVGTGRGIPAVSTDHDGTLRAECRRFRVAAAVASGHLGAPR